MASEEQASAIAAVKAHVAEHGPLTCQEPTGALTHKFLTPGGYYKQLWDWDSVFTGIGLASRGGLPYLAGSMRNFLELVDDAGMVPGCLTVGGPSSTIKQSKPILIQGAWLAGKAAPETFLPLAAAMGRFLAYWERERLHADTDCFLWWDAMESGTDNSPYHEEPSGHVPEWNEARHALAVTSPDLMTFLAREYQAFAAFNEAWALSAEAADAEEHLREAAACREKVDRIRAAINKYMWDDDAGYFYAYNVKDGVPLKNKTWQCAMPMFAGLATPEQAARCFAVLHDDTMMSPWGLRSTSADDPRYSNLHIIDPYSEWRGPIWVVANMVNVWGLHAYGYGKEARQLALRVIAMLAKDSTARSAWSECYSGEDGSPLAADGFLSWNVLAADVVDLLDAGTNPFEI